MLCISGFMDNAILSVVGQTKTTQAGRLLKVTQHGAASDRGRSLMSTNTLCVAYNKFLLFCDCEPNEYGVSLNVTGTRGKGDCAKSKGPDQLLSAWSLVLRRMYSACLCSPSLSVESRHAIFHACTFCNNVDLLQ